MFKPEQCDFVSMAEAKARAEQNPVAETARAASIAFVVMAEAGQIDDVTATENVEQFAPWAYPIAYKKGNIRRYGSDLYRCNQDHTSQADWTPAAAAALWSKIGDPAEEWPEWSQPVGSTDAYAKGAKVSHNGPSRSAPMTPMTPARRCPITGSTGRPTSRRTSGNLASTVGRR